jgi:hypothetical protein
VIATQYLENKYLSESIDALESTAKYTPCHGFWIALGTRERKREVVVKGEVTGTGKYYVYLGRIFGLVLCVIPVKSEPP